MTADCCIYRACAVLAVVVLLHSTRALTSFPEVRRHVLLPWTGDESTPLGWALETRPREDGSCNVTVSWNCKDDQEVTCEMPGVLDSAEDLLDENATVNDLSTSLWPSGIAGAILCKSPAFISAVGGKSVLELGSGMGLQGWVAGLASASTTLTDHCSLAVRRLDVLAKHGLGSISTKQLDWRDEDQSGEIYDVIIGADIAYYWYLLRPIMDTVKKHLGGDFVMITGGANRESQWDLYTNIHEGCYNQLTDKKESSWPGHTRLLLYKMQVGAWSTAADNEDVVDKVTPIAVLLNEQTGTLSFSDLDHVATKEDRENILISF